MKITAITKTDNSAFGNSIRVSPIMIPNKKIPRVDENDIPYTVEFSEQQVVDSYKKFYETGGTKIANGTHFIIESEMCGFPKGTWVCIEEVDEGYMIEAIVDENNDCTISYKFECDRLINKQ